EVIIADGGSEGPDDGEETFIINDIKLLADAEPMRAREAAIRLPNGKSDERTYETIFKLLSDNRGECGIRLRVPAGNVEAEIEAAHIRVKGTAKLQQELTELGCSVEWII